MDALSSANRHAKAQAQLRMHSHQETQNDAHIPSPFGQLAVEFTDSELRETAYEIVVGACRSSASGRPLKFVSNSERSDSTSSSSSQSLQKSSSASKVKKALGFKSKKKNRSDSAVAADQTQNSASRKRASTVGELMRVQMNVSEQTDSRVRRGLLRVAAGQLGRRIESYILPLELLQQLKLSDFSSQQDYEAWQRRNLKVLEAGLLFHPSLPLHETDTQFQQLRGIIRGALVKPIDTGKYSDSMQALRNVASSLACRSFDGSVSQVYHWADGIPFNLRLYEILLKACFDVDDATSMIEEVDEVLEIIKKTWGVLGINQMLHNICFLWVLFHHYVFIGQDENDLLFAAENLLLEVQKDGKTTKDPTYSKILSSILGLILGWAEKRLLAYHNSYYRSNIDIMQSVLSIAISAAKILAEDMSHEYSNKRREVDVAYNRVDSYIRSSLHNAFTQENEKLISCRRSSKNQRNSLPILSILAQNISDLAFNEKEIYSPVLKRWHPLATGVAVATLHACYGDELKKFVSSINELTPDAVQVLIAADKLEKNLVKMAVADAVESDDGGKALIQEMIPFEAEAVIVNLVKSWIRTRVDRLKEWVERNLQQEIWNPRANKERVAPSGVEALRVIDETLEAFFLLPIPMHPALLPELLSGLDRCLQNYIFNIKSGCGSQSDFIPKIPSLTRCATGKIFGVFKKKERTNMVVLKNSHSGTLDGNDAFGLPQLCVRINTLHHIRKQLEVLEKRTIAQLRDSGCVHNDNMTIGLGKSFELSASACIEGIKQLSETIAYKVVFHDLSHVFWDFLYVGNVSSSRTEPFLQELEKNLEIISSTVHDRVRTRVITDVMKASFEGLSMILLAGGPFRAFTIPDAAIIDEDFKFLMDLFWSDGDGLPSDLIDKYSVNLKGILQLLHTDTENLITQFQRVMEENYGASGKSMPLPPTSGRWSPSEPNTILRVLCYRNDKVATKFIKKHYNLPKKL
ncbi:PREDICTED: uncharacterized protein LOC109159568 [Ipomoea nil]|uniref:uncharacterized protein LOC109159568 n=1 Tax=Ipomoea nil TaxID=35883 RepID=UPI000901EB8D|nr:PREDICTED: uncharacterized protein LOC109159568 [Ipomoea nil]